MATTIPKIEPIKVVAQVLQTEMGLDDGHIMLGMANWKIPDDTGLYVSLLYGPETVVANNNYNGVDTHGTYIEIQDAVMLHFIEIDLMSFDSSARLNKEALLWALASATAMQAMDLNDMRIAKIPQSFIPIPDPEPSKQLNRFKLTIAVNALHRNVKGALYYDKIRVVDLIADA